MADIKVDFPEFVNIFNTQGKDAARLLAREKYNRSFEYIQRKVRYESDYYFDRTLRKYKNKDKNIIEADFMSLDELDNYGTQAAVTKSKEPLPGLSKDESFDQLINELIKDRMLELSKYISISHETRQLTVKSKTIKNDGLSLIII
ncbi:hypothetical protein SAMN05444401_1487 [Clostridium amylolyticum]|uniref:Uncharacterized protein n=1 Tax=Clostridium amylolyticum TaxID=1121298 RepID=A0A1M6DJA7_9CLOT|nr:hypothetical protein [Clostridium amylolyticum]SHI73088.1 hypothetical protein SAMN05444401_1487 [Clostridium amylolyticum]